MLRYLRLYASFIRFSFSKAMEFRLDFFFRIVMDAVWYAVQLAFFGVLYLHTDLLGGWDADQILIFVAAFFVIDAVHMTVFANNMWMLPRFINKGDLDYYLVRPVSPLFFLALRDFAANSFFNLLMAGGIMVWALARFPGDLAAVNIACFLALLAVGSVLYWVMYMFFIIPVFWLHTEGGIRTLYFEIEKLAERPDQIYTRWVRRVLLSVVPLALVASVPTHVLFDGLDPLTLAHVLGVTAAAFGVMVFFWRRGLRSYASASS